MGRRQNCKFPLWFGPSVVFCRPGFDILTTGKKLETSSGWDLPGYLDLGTEARCRTPQQRTKPCPTVSRGQRTDTAMHLGTPYLQRG